MCMPCVCDVYAMCMRCVCDVLFVAQFELASLSHARGMFARCVRAQRWRIHSHRVSARARAPPAAGVCGVVFGGFFGSRAEHWAQRRGTVYLPVGGRGRGLVGR